MGRARVAHSMKVALISAGLASRRGRGAGLVARRGRDTDKPLAAAIGLLPLTTTCLPSCRLVVPVVPPLTRTLPHRSRDRQDTKESTNAVAY